MARFNPHQKSAALYPAIENFADHCLLNDGSLLEPTQRLWTAENFSELDRTFVQNPDEGTDSYYQSLSEKSARMVSDAETRAQHVARSTISSTSR